MKLIEAINDLRGRPAEIPDCSRHDLPEFFVQIGYQVGAEIGVYKGEFTKCFLDAGLRVYAVDPWKAYRNYNQQHEKHLVERGNLDFQARQNFLYGHTRRYLAEYIASKRCTIVRKMSMDAVEAFDDGNLDFVYIDGHHGFRYIAEDLFEWTRIVRKGGIVSGHDYAVNRKGAHDPFVLHVKPVLHAFIEAYRIPNWYVLGRKETLPGEKRDKFRSWMFIKDW